MSTVNPSRLSSILLAQANVYALPPSAADSATPSSAPRRASALPVATEVPGAWLSTVGVPDATSTNDSKAH